MYNYLKVKDVRASQSATPERTPERVVKVCFVNLTLQLVSSYLQLHSWLSAALFLLAMNIFLGPFLHFIILHLLANVEILWLSSYSRELGW